jgi:hypothetical protein
VREGKILEQVDEIVKPAEVSEEEYVRRLEEFAKERDSILFKTSDVLPPFLRALKDQEWDTGAYDRFLNTGSMAYTANVVFNGDPDDEDEFWKDKKTDDFQKNLFVALTDVAPPGFYFGLDNMGMGIFGFWKNKALPDVEWVEPTGSLEVEVVDEVSTAVIAEITERIDPDDQGSD